MSKQDQDVMIRRFPSYIWKAMKAVAVDQERPLREVAIDAFREYLTRNHGAER